MRFLYEITKSNVDTVVEGTFIIDTSDEPYQRGEPRGWTLYDKQAGHFFDGWTGVCLHRVCGPCFDQGMAREHKHNGRHGPAGCEPHLTPMRLTVDELANA